MSIGNYYILVIRGKIFIYMLGICLRDVIFVFLYYINNWNKLFSYVNWYWGWDFIIIMKNIWLW